MTVVLSCSTSWCQNNDTIPPMGGLEQSDSIVSIPVSYLKLANGKMIELKYEKEINNKLRNIVYNDSLIIDGINYELDNCIKNKEIEVKKARKQRNIFIVSTIGAALVSLLILLK